MASRLEPADGVGVEVLERLLELLERCGFTEGSLVGLLRMLRGLVRHAKALGAAVTWPYLQYVSYMQESHLEPHKPSTFRRECSQLGTWLLQPALWALGEEEGISIELLGSDTSKNMVVVLKRQDYPPRLKKLFSQVRSGWPECKQEEFVQRAVTRLREKPSPDGAPPSPDEIAVSRPDGAPDGYLPVTGVGQGLSAKVSKAAMGRATPVFPGRSLVCELTQVVCCLELTARSSPEVLSRLMEPYREGFRWAMGWRKGEVHADSSRRMIAFFGSEAHARTAVQSALRFVRLMERRRKATSSDDLQLKVRVVVHSCKATVNPRPGQPLHDILADEAAETTVRQLLSVAPPDTVVICPKVLLAVNQFFEYRPVPGGQGNVGAAAGVSAYQITDEKNIPGMFDPAVKSQIPLIGREKELDALVASWRAAKAGRPKVAWVSGMPGVGVTRLIQELVVQVRGGKDRPWIFFCQCWDYQQLTPLGPVAEMLKSYLGVKWVSGAERRRQKLQTFISQVGLNPAEASPALERLVADPVEDFVAQRGRHTDGCGYHSAESEQRHSQVLDVLESLLLGIAATHPTILIAEDLHWADATTQDLLNRVLRKLADCRKPLPLLMVVTFHGEIVAGADGDAGLHTHIQLEPLKEDCSREMVQRICQAEGTHLSEEQLGCIVKGAEGMPHRLLELSSQGWGQSSSTKVLSAIRGHGDIAQLAAALGQEFSYGDLLALMRRLSPPNPSLEELLKTELAALVGMEFLTRKGVPPEAVYRFSLSHFRNCLLESLAPETRASFHRAIAEFFEQKASEQGGVTPEVVARHYAASGPTGVEKAVFWWSQAAQLAMHNSDYRVAISATQEAIAGLRSLAPSTERTKSELKLLLGVVPAYYAVGTPEEFMNAIRKATELAKSIDEIPLVFKTEWMTWFRMYLRGELEKAVSVAEELWRAEPCVDLLDCRLEAYHAMWGTLFHRGEMRRALAFHFRGLALLNADPSLCSEPWASGHSPRCCNLMRGAWSLWYLGMPEQALDTSVQGVGVAESLENEYALAHALCHVSFLHLLCRDYAKAQEYSQRALKIAEELPFAQRRAMARMLLCSAMAQQEPGTDRVEQLRSALDQWRKTGVRLFDTFWLAMLAESCLRCGSTADGLEALNEASRISSQTQERFYEPELLRLRGELLLKKSKGNRLKAITAVKDAARVAADMDARSLELRAILSLNRLLEQCGTGRAERRRALQDLRKARDWFREGYSMPDLKGADTFIASHS